MKDEYTTGEARPTTVPIKKLKLLIAFLQFAVATTFSHFGFLLKFGINSIQYQPKIALFFTAGILELGECLGKKTVVVASERL